MAIVWNSVSVVVHMRAAINARLRYGRDEARIFLEQLGGAGAGRDITVASAGLKMCW